MCHLHPISWIHSPDLIFKAQTLCFNRYSSACRWHPQRCWRCRSPSWTNGGVLDAWQVPAIVFKNEMLCRYESVRHWHATDSSPASPSAPAAPAFVRCQAAICRWEERRPLSTPIQMNSKTHSPCISGPACATFGQRSSCFWAEADLKA